MTIAVLGTGESIKDYKGELAIGVHDVWRYVQTQYVICTDSPKRFTIDRRTIINECRPIKLFSHLQSWSDHPCFEKVTLHSPRGKANYKAEGLSYGIMSVLPAMVLAYKLGATQINLYGIDLVNHKSFKDVDRMEKCIKHLQNFISACPVPVTMTENSPIFDRLTF